MYESRRDIEYCIRVYDGWNALDRVHVQKCKVLARIKFEQYEYLHIILYDILNNKQQKAMCRLLSRKAYG